MSTSPSSGSGECPRLGVASQENGFEMRDLRPLMSPVGSEPDLGRPVALRVNPRDVMMDFDWALSLCEGVLAGRE